MFMLKFPCRIVIFSITLDIKVNFDSSSSCFRCSHFTFLLDVICERGDKIYLFSFPPKHEAAMQSYMFVESFQLFLSSREFSLTIWRKLLAAPQRKRKLFIVIIYSAVFVPTTYASI